MYPEYTQERCLKVLEELIAIDKAQKTGSVGIHAVLVYGKQRAKRPIVDDGDQYSLMVDTIIFETYKELCGYSGSTISKLYTASIAIRSDVGVEAAPEYRLTPVRIKETVEKVFQITKVLK